VSRSDRSLLSSVFYFYFVAAAYPVRLTVGGPSWSRPPVAEDFQGRT